jgi:hypothetical protein
MQSRVYSVDEVKIESLIVIPENPPAISVSVLGWVPTTAWSQPDLAAWMYITPPKDGLLDLDFVATAPTGIVIPVFDRIGIVKSMPIPHWVKGVRIHCSTNEMTAVLPGGVSAASSETETVPYPWPWPWWSPKTPPRR